MINDFQVAARRVPFRHRVKTHRVRKHQKGKPLPYGLPCSYPLQVVVFKGENGISGEEGKGVRQSGFEPVFKRMLVDTNIFCTQPLTLYPLTYKNTNKYNKLYRVSYRVSIGFYVVRTKIGNIGERGKENV